MQPPPLAFLLALSNAALSMSAAGLTAFAIALWFARSHIAGARGIHRIGALAPICFAIPLAVFGAEHLSLNRAMAAGVPSYMPFHLFWIYFVGVALLAASLSIATARQVRWSALLFGIMMFAFVAMLHLPGAIKTGGRIPWTIVFRELSFGGGAWVLAGAAMAGRNSPGPGNPLRTVGRALIGCTALFFGIEHFLHPLGLPGVPLEKQMPAWVPLRPAVDYVTGAALIILGFCLPFDRKTRLLTACLGAWLVLLVLVIYGPVLLTALANPNAALQIEGINYFADTLLFAGVILSLAASGPPTHPNTIPNAMLMADDEGSNHLPAFPSSH
ncbi:MAG: hypothetical protein JO340_10045 [Acidobacteriaceae bacterium]|nr:hypothetical protein [Acidobacteriaceae bacterium]